MTKKILIDASHAEETRVVVLDGNRLEDFDVETATRKQIKGNIYLAKVIRVEPSLQAAFVEYGGNRHGFLAFDEIHPDYYQIPVADRQRLLAQQAEDAAQEEAEAEASAGNPSAPPPASTAQALDIKPIEITAAPPPEPEVPDEPAQTESEYREAAEPAVHASETNQPDVDGGSDQPDTDQPDAGPPNPDLVVDRPDTDSPDIDSPDAGRPETDQPDSDQPEPPHHDSGETDQPADPDAEAEVDQRAASSDGDDAPAPDAEDAPAAPPPESLGGDGDDAAEERERRRRQRFMRQYKIQEVVHRRQILLIQVVKEERGNKGAALTTYLSLAGRFSVLMPNSPSGGGVSRKITSVADRRRLKEAMAELDVPSGMGLIVRTAGANRPKPEITRDCEYLLRLWDDIRDRTMESIAPALIYEEASLIKRAIRDVYTKDVEDVLVDGEEGYKAARDFMSMLMPSHTRKVQFWQDGQPLFAKFQVEAQLDAMLNPTVQLRSGGYIVINQTEALVAIDVNSGRSTRERSIEDTALRTNLEAADEAARQLRMRDLAGLIVIDFIDMESRKNNASVERRLKEALKNDRARIQVGSISHFGLMEMSRQRIRPSVTEASLMLCPHCAGMGHIRSPESAALHILRAIEDEGAKFRAAEIAVFLPPEIAIYLFNHKRDRLNAIEARYAMRVLFSADPAMVASNYRIEKLKAQTAPLPAPPPAPTPSAAMPQPPAEEDTEPDNEDEDGAEAAKPGDTTEEGERGHRRRRRRGKRRPEPNGQVEPGEPADADAGVDASADTSVAEAAPPAMEEPSPFDLVLAAELGEPSEPATEDGAEPTARRRRRRGGRSRRGPADGTETQEASTEPDAALDGAELPLLPFDTAAEPAAANPEPVDIAPAGLSAPAAPPAEPPEEPTEAAPAEPLAAALESIAAFTVATGTEADAAETPAPNGHGEPAPATALEPASFAGGPIIIGADAPAAEKKRGWWRR